MREIKFRAWDKTNNRWENFCTINTYGHIAILYTSESVAPSMLQIHPRDDFYERIFNNLGIPKPEIVIMQYTGLKDKNGKEIYEGDIVESFFTNSFGTHKRKDVVWFDISRQLFEGTAYPRDDGFIVLGNIYENPELLEDENGHKQGA